MQKLPDFKYRLSDKFFIINISRVYDIYFMLFLTSKSPILFLNI